jgi:mono/diheme cytochrome c family protein
MARNDTPARRPLHDDRWIVDAVHRLDREFGGALGQADIAQVVSWSRADLDGPHPAAMPELVERLARQRLLQRLAAAVVPAVGVPVG